MSKKLNIVRLSPRQVRFANSYLRSDSGNFANCYQAARSAGYSESTARNLTHLQPKWLSETLGTMAHELQPDDLTNALSTIIDDSNEPTIIRIKAIELMMRYHQMLQSSKPTAKTLTLEVNLAS